MANILVSISIEHTVHRNNSYPGTRWVLLSSSCTRMVQCNNRRFPHIHRHYLQIKRSNACGLHHNLALQQDYSTKWSAGKGGADGATPAKKHLLAIRSRRSSPLKAALRRVLPQGNGQKTEEYGPHSEEAVHIKNTPLHKYNTNVSSKLYAVFVLPDYLFIPTALTCVRRNNSRCSILIRSISFCVFALFCKIF